MTVQPLALVGTDIDGQRSEFDALALVGHRAKVRYALTQMQAKRDVIDRMWDYYNGDHPALWMTRKIADLFRGMNNRLSDNLCETAVDSVVNRLQVTGWEAAEAGDGSASDAAVEDAALVFEQHGLDLEQEDLYRHALVSGTGYVLVWPDEQGNPEPVVQDPRTIHVEYGSLRATDRIWAAKVWHDGWTWRANLYFRGEGDRSSYVVRLLMQGRTSPNTPPDATRFVYDPEDPGGDSGLPNNACPVVPFERRRGGRSRLWNLIPIQDKINKLAANKMVAAEFAAFRQRVFITQQQVADGTLKNAPDQAIILDPGTRDAPTSVHEFAITELANYDNAIAAEVSKFFTVASLPRHIIVGVGSAPPSGDAIKADEGPFVAYVDSLAKRFGAAWADVMLLLGLPVKPVWTESEVHNDLTTAQTVKTFTDAGVPVGPVLVRYAGWDQQDADAAMQAVTAQQVQAASAGAVALAAFDAGLSPDNALPTL